MTNGIGTFDDADETNYSNEGRSTIVYEAACPHCGRTVTWYAHPHAPHPVARCPQPSCNTDRLVET